MDTINHGPELTDGERRPIEERVSRLLAWEKRKRRESTFIVALLYAFAAALAVPLFVSLPLPWAWTAPALILFIVAPWLLFMRRWRDGDTARTLAALDRRLRLDERATTAWDLLRRNETGAAARLVLRQASEHLESGDIRRLFPRSWGWRVWLLPPLIALWFGLLHFDARFGLHGGTPQASSPLAYELREFARELEQKAERERLPKTLAAARELEKIARRAIETGATDETLKRELAGTGQKIAAERKAAGQTPFAGSASKRELGDLRAELEAARESFGTTDAEAQSWQERLAGLSQLKKQLDAQPGGGRELSRSELKGLLDKLEENAASELDRRALVETEEYLKSVPQRDRDRHGEGRPRPGPYDDFAEPVERWAEKIPGTAPGDAIGEKGDAPPRAELKGAQRAQVKSALGEGARSTTFFKATPAPGKSVLSQDEVVASYQRQAESELGTERIPEPLKDTIRNYFLSLEKTK